MSNNKLHILITGANGQLGTELRSVLAGYETVAPIFTDVDELDITNPVAIQEFFAQNRIDIVVNCAAFTAVDKAEDDAALATTLNATAVEMLATAAKQHGARMLHVSTDYVFDGQACRPYREDDEPSPASVYGSTKLLGEQKLLAVMPQAIIVRTAWLYSPHGHNFVKTMLELGRKRDNLKVVVDQVGSPTYALDLARAIAAIVTAQQWKPGIYHYSNEGAVSWYDFTKMIHCLAGIGTCHVSACMSHDYPTRATRPHYSVLDKSKVKAAFGIEVPYWADSLKHCLGRMAE